MSVKSSKSSKLNKPKIIAQFGIDILAVYLSENEDPISLEEALAKIQTLYSSKHASERPQAKKSIMQIVASNTGLDTVVIKSHNGKQILESFSIKSMGTPQIGNLPTDKYKTQSLVFLPVLNKDLKSELFVFHPHTLSAQEVVIELVKMLQIKEIIHNQSLPRPSLSPPKSEVDDIVEPIISNLGFSDHESKNGENEEVEVNSDYSLSSTFLQNWFTKVENMVCTTPNSLYQSCDYRPTINGLNEEVYLLNQNLKEIRVFMNNLYNAMHDVIKDNGLENGIITRIVKLPPKLSFIEVIQKIKASLNMAAVHESLIINPSSKEIINQLLLILRILGDATKDNFTNQPIFVKSIKTPTINELAIKFLTENLNPLSKEFWMVLGENYGYINNTKSKENYKAVIDEFQIRRELIISKEEKIKPQLYNKSLDKEIEKNFDKNYEFDLFDDDTKLPERSYEKYHQRNNNKIHENRYYRNYDSENDRESENKYLRQNIFHSQPNLNYSQPLRSVPFLEDELTYRSNQPLYDLERQNFGISMHQKHNGRNHDHYSYSNPNSSTWKDRQCRFIDAVRLRNGRLMKITQDRSAQNKREISVSCNEVVELLADYGDVFSAKNALGEVGYCPSSIAQNVSFFSIH